MAITFSAHSMKKMRLRTKLRMPEVRTILETRRYIVLGCNGLHNQRIHKLYYSTVDEAHYVAIQDKYSLEVITILLPEYDYSFQITSEHLNEARYVERFPPELNEEEVSARVEAQSLSFVLAFESSKGDIKFRRLKSLIIEELRKLENNQRVQVLQSHLDLEIRRHLPHKDTFNYVTMSQGKRGEPQVLPYQYKPPT